MPRLINQQILGYVKSKIDEFAYGDTCDLIKRRIEGRDKINNPEYEENVIAGIECAFLWEIKERREELWLAYGDVGRVTGRVRFPGTVEVTKNDQIRVVGRFDNPLEEGEIATFEVINVDDRDQFGLIIAIAQITP